MKRKVVLIGALLIFGLLVGSYFNYIYSARDVSIEENKVSDQADGQENKESVYLKSPPIDASVWRLHQSLTERVWATKYYKTPSEIFTFSDDMPLCRDWPDEKNYPYADIVGPSKYMWLQKCKPVEVMSKQTADDFSGIVVVRMLDFGSSPEIIQDVFQIIQNNSLGAYKIDKERKEDIKKIIKKIHGPITEYSPVNYRYKLKTYSNLEGYFFLEKDGQGDSEATRDPESYRNNSSSVAKKRILSLKYSSQIYTKSGNIVEFTFIAPPGFFGISH